MKNSNVLVSIIVPVYNAEKYLTRCVESILNQSYRNIECILVDDGSIDDSADICDKFAQEDIRILCIHQKNAGVSAARNKGLDVANGDYLCFVDSDDYLALNMVEENLNIALKQQAEIVCFNYFNLSGEKILRSSTYKSGDTNESILTSFFKGITEKAIWNKFYKKSIWSNLRFPVDMRYAEDWFVLSKAFVIANKVIGNSGVYYFYNTLNENSIVHNINYSAEYLNFICTKKQLEIIDSNKNVIDNYKELFSFL